MSMTSRRVAAACAGLAFTFQLASPAVAQTPLGAATPQDLVARLTRAAETRNLAEIAACVDPKSRTELTMGLLIGATMMIAFAGMGSEMAEGMAQAMGGEQKPADKAAADKKKARAQADLAKAKAQLSAVFKKHGLPDLMDESAALPQEEGAAEKMLARVDQPALAADLLGVMQAAGGDKMKGNEAGPIDAPKDVGDYKIAGDKATARAGAETLDFVKIDGKWFLTNLDKGKKDPASK